MSLLKIPGRLLAAIFAGSVLFSIGQCASDNEEAGREPGDITLDNTTKMLGDTANNIGTAAGTLSNLAGDMKEGYDTHIKPLIPKDESYNSPE